MNTYKVIQIKYTYAEEGKREAPQEYVTIVEATRFEVVGGDPMDHCLVFFKPDRTGHGLPTMIKAAAFNNWDRVLLLEENK